MLPEELYKLRFPIGEFSIPESVSDESIKEMITHIELFPSKIKSLTLDLSVEQLQWTYRPGGWSIKQLVHHCSDSHINSLIRFKWALTENEPTIKPYDEITWAELSDATDDDISHSIKLLEAIHYKWVKLLRSLDEEMFSKAFIHPHGEIRYSLKQSLAMYAWHSQHHYAHIKLAIDAKGKYN